MSSNIEENFITAADFPNGVAVGSGHVYWANLGAHTIGRANLDGSNPDQSFISGAGDPQGVAVGSGHVYWANGFVNDTIGRAELPEGPGGPTNIDPSLITLSRQEPRPGSRSTPATGGAPVSCP